MIAAAEPMLHMMATDNNFDIDITTDLTKITDENLAHYQVFLQLQEAPFDIPRKEQDVIQRYVEGGGGWVGIHAAGLTGRTFLVAGMHYWQWYQDFLGGVSYSPHPKFQKGTLIIEDHSSPITRELPDKWVLSDEWYEFDHSPRGAPGIHVLARADESTYHQNKPMGDHPMIWVNTNYRRMVYIAIGHDAYLCSDPNFEKLIRDSILWAATKD